MIVRLRLDFDDNERRAIAYEIGKDGLASWNECRRFALSAISGELDTVRHDFERRESHSQSGPNEASG